MSAGARPRGSPAEFAPAYAEIRSPAAEWIARRDCAEAIRQGAADALFREPAAGTVTTATGRAPIARLRLGETRAIGKRSLHGGLLGPLLGRLYLGSGRGLDQLRAAIRLRGSGIPTPEVLAVGSAPVCGPLRAQAIVTRELEGGRNLYEVSGGAPAPTRRREILRMCAGLVRRLHDAGFLHADLNVGNLVLQPGPAGETLHVIDLDRGRFLPVLSPRVRLANLARLLRSYEKWIACSLRLTRREEVDFLRCYARGDRALVRDLARRLARYRTRLGLRPWRRRPAGPPSESRLAGPLQ
ncbi:MAG TPA: lipopolysaccharide kinase InaA family protein [Candidatus Polarisedimenticolia bacterium]|nr:lipopolysaccharide kinase InaA family protein [Candidatus Polarisedimenticolia bacterium]